jgi:formylmethanofuran dehydrogenase subunit E
MTSRKLLHTGTAAMNLHLRAGLLALLLVGGFGIAPIRAETPEEWIKLGARVHGGFGSFIPVGIRIGEDAMKRLSAQPRELSVLYYSGEGVPCACSVDGVMLAVSASPGQGSVQVAAEKSPPGTFAVVVIRPRKGGDGLKYTVPMSHMVQLGEINRTMQDPLARYNAVVGINDLFVVEAETRSSR